MSPKARKSKAAPAETEQDPVDEALHGRNIGKLWEKYRKTGDMEARNALVEFYFDLVRANSENIAEILARAIEDNDLYQAGVVGFFEALNEYDPKSGVAFEEFGSIAVRHSILAEIKGLISGDDPGDEEE